MGGGHREQRLYQLLCLAHPLGGKGGRVDAEELGSRLRGNAFSDERFASARWSKQ